MEYINQRINTFLGLNNALNPASAEYREGMAWRSKEAHIDRAGVWDARPALVSATGAPGTVSAGSGDHFKNLALEGTDKIITGLDTTDACDVGTNRIAYITTGSGNVRYLRASGTSDDVEAPPKGTVSSAPAASDTGVESRAESGDYYYIFTSYSSTFQHESLPWNNKAYMATLDKDSGNLNITMTLTANGDGDEIRILSLIHI